MSKDSSSMHIAVIPSKQGDKTYYCTLLRQSFRDPQNKKKIRKKTLANISSLPPECINLLKLFFKGHSLIPSDLKNGPMNLLSSKYHGHIEAIICVFKKIGVAELIASKSSSHANLICALIASRIINPCSKIPSPNWWQLDETTISDYFPEIKTAQPHHIHEALDELAKLQNNIQKKLAKRFLAKKGAVLYYLSSSHFEKKQCSLGADGYSRDHKSKKLQINYRLVCNALGNPVALSPYTGDGSDSNTIKDEVRRLQKTYGISNIILVGDREMITQSKIDEFKKLEGIGWVSALKKSSIKSFLNDERVQELRKKKMCEWQCDKHPNERFIACYNHDLAKKQASDRDALLQLTEDLLKELKNTINSKAKMLNVAEMGRVIGLTENKFKMKNYFDININIKDQNFVFSRNKEKIKESELLDGIYVIRTSISQNEKSTSECVKTYKSLTYVHRAFRVIKNELNKGAISHWKEQHVSAYLFLCMLIYCVEWHMRTALKELIFVDDNLEENIEHNEHRDPVLAALPSNDFLENKNKNDQGLEVMSFQSLIDNLGKVSMCEYEINYDKNSATPSEPMHRTFKAMSQRTLRQQKALDLLQNI